MRICFLRRVSTLLMYNSDYVSVIISLGGMFKINFQQKIKQIWHCLVSLTSYEFFIPYFGSKLIYDIDKKFDFIYRCSYIRYYCKRGKEKQQTTNLEI